MACEAHNAARLVGNMDGRLANLLAGIPYSSSIIVALTFPDSAFRQPLKGFGFLVPKCERGRLVACTMVGGKFSHRVPAGTTLLRCFLGGMDDGGILAESDSAIIATVVRVSCTKLHGIRGDAYVLTYFSAGRTPWPNMPSATECAWPRLRRAPLPFRGCNWWATRIQASGYRIAFVWENKLPNLFPGCYAPFDAPGFGNSGRVFRGRVGYGGRSSRTDPLPGHAARCSTSATSIRATPPGDLSPVVRKFPSLVYVPNSGSNTVDVIDPRNYRIVGHFRVGRQPQHVTPSYDLKTLWVLSDLGDSITQIDPATGKKGKTLKIKDPYNMYYTPDGKYGLHRGCGTHSSARFPRGTDHAPGEIRHGAVPRRGSHGFFSQWTLPDRQL